MLFASLGSGSRGNATLVEVGNTRVLVDCGFSRRELTRRLLRCNRTPEALSAILVTHEHTDHVSGVARVARHFGVPVWATRGTAAGACLPGDVMWHVIEKDTPFCVGEIQVQPYAVPHDAREPCQFVFGDGVRRLGLLTDAGAVTPVMEAALADCDALMLECNYDATLLANGPYPAALKARVGGLQGHLGNDQSADLLARLCHARLQHVVALHLSEKNNRPGLARQCLAEALGCATHWIGVADQAQGLAWREIC